MVSPSRLKAAQNNARTHSKRQIQLIAESIRRYGVINPVIVDPKERIVAGHARAAAAQLLGLHSIPVIQVEHLSETELRAYALADNALADKSGWNRDLLAVELRELVELIPAEGMDISLTGFEPPEIDLLFADMTDASGREAEPPIPAPPVIATTQASDLWQLGKHRLLCGDARDPNALARVTGGQSVAAVFTDPPYNVAVKSIGGRGRIRHREFAFASGEMTRQQFGDFLVKTLGNGVDVSAPGAVHYVCMDWRHIDVLIETGRELYEAMLNLAVWNKTNAGQGSFYRSQHELIGVFRVAGSSHRNNVELGRFGRNRSNVWTYAGVNTFAKGRLNALAAHPTVKPIALVADALLDCTARGDHVLDQFAGVATTLLAAEKTGRVGFGIEIDAKYIDCAIERWQKITKRDATLAADGRTFEEVAVARRHSERVQRRKERRRG